MNYYFYINLFSGMVENGDTGAQNDSEALMRKLRAL